MMLFVPALLVKSASEFAFLLFEIRLAVLHTYSIKLEKAVWPFSGKIFFDIENKDGAM